MEVTSVGTKLASIIVHYEEYLSPTGAPEDRLAAETLRSDPEVVEYIESLRTIALLPVKR